MSSRQPGLQNETLSWKKKIINKEKGKRKERQETINSPRCGGTHLSPSTAKEEEGGPLSAKTAKTIQTNSCLGKLKDRKIRIKN